MVSNDWDIMAIYILTALMLVLTCFQSHNTLKFTLKMSYIQDLCAKRFQEIVYISRQVDVLFQNTLVESGFGHTL